MGGHIPVTSWGRLGGAEISPAATPAEALSAPASPHAGGGLLVDRTWSRGKLVA
jgi:hypothetical protein